MIKIDMDKIKIDMDKKDPMTVELVYRHVTSNNDVKFYFVTTFFKI